MEFIAFQSRVEKAKKKVVDIELKIANRLDALKTKYYSDTNRDKLNIQKSSLESRRSKYEFEKQNIENYYNNEKEQHYKKLIMFEDSINSRIKKLQTDLEQEREKNRNYNNYCDTMLESKCRKLRTDLDVLDEKINHIENPNFDEYNDFTLTKLKNELRDAEKESRESEEAYERVMEEKRLIEKRAEKEMLDRIEAENRAIAQEEERNRLEHLKQLEERKKNEREREDRRAKERAEEARIAYEREEEEKKKRAKKLEWYCNFKEVVGKDLKYYGDLTPREKEVIREFSTLEESYDYLKSKMSVIDKYNAFYDRVEDTDFLPSDLKTNWDLLSIDSKRLVALEDDDELKKKMIKRLSRGVGK